MRRWLIEWKARFSGDLFYGFKIFDAETRDGAEMRVKMILRKKGWDIVSVGSSCFPTHSIEFIIAEKEIYIGTREKQVKS